MLIIYRNVCLAHFILKNQPYTKKLCEGSKIWDTLHTVWEVVWIFWSKRSDSIAWLLSRFWKNYQSWDLPIPFPGYILDSRVSNTCGNPYSFLFFEYTLISKILFIYCFSFSSVNRISGLGSRSWPGLS